MLQTSNYSLVLSLQFLLLSYDLFVNSFSELLRMAPVIQLVLFIIQDIAVLFNIIIIFLMFFNTFVFQAGLVNLLFHKFKGTIILTAMYFALSISLHVWVMNLRWKDSNRFVWTDGLQTLFVFQRLGKDQTNVRSHFGPSYGLAVRALILPCPPITAGVGWAEQPHQEQERVLSSALIRSHWEILRQGPSASLGYVLT
ncbi:transmembrane protein 138 isoform X1 [Rousettus aegyptiacus]|uniref:Transmembrane protein 138 n=1 Tax=Rousettus aegyptiacus TaxID=9407 RepID=A0A7J8H7R0_ROUAE|nr:transmembrane protein 138 isoform X1 [Rousettus aegyptiacus]XP_015989685.1 transmembrane protein 138 isoform X1 [Rousettus aegyptiacus]XP_015989686.1 transmembrane protein 138 isoform X1 [Rousettus aegyptiacus]XP_015989687.1 transmembrane protein 138 isoform X1 [Rousettus aegyptiacus]XP_036077013.1 transmembrane protein 138 isoform X1 [Rousettus aegyptiacus]KAF6468276.1 transmembrane protein 138 [Rousettus aegyptiacus]